jgi:hypothetical protein
MADWKKIAEGLDAGIPGTQIETIRPTLEALEKMFQPLVLTLRPEDDIATPFAPEIEG